MRELEEDFLDAPLEDQRELHAALAFYWTLNDLERTALSNRFQDELGNGPAPTDADEDMRITWDVRSRELVNQILDFADVARAAGMELVSEVGASEDVAVLAMTANGSLLELDRPEPDGSRRFVYLSGSIGGESRCEGIGALEDAVRPGVRARLGENSTSSLLVLACGPELPPDELLAPAAAAPEDSADELISEGFACFSEAVEAVETAKGQALRSALQARAAEWASLLQQAVAATRRYALHDLTWFETNGGSRYEVVQHDQLDIMRRASDESEDVLMQSADIGEQHVVVGAPLVIHYGPPAARHVAFVFKIAELQSK